MAIMTKEETETETATKIRAHWPINEIAKITGLTSRALRHYDAIGLLAPAWTSDSGRRYYTERDLLRLQEILLLRSLGLRLETIAEALTDRGDEERIGMLTQHLSQLKRERGRIDRLIKTVSRTIQNLKESRAMQPDDMFDGLREAPYEPEARKLYGDEAIDQAKERVKRLNKQDREAVTSGRAFQDVHARLAKLKARGLAVDDPSVQDVIARHYEIVSWVWKPNADTYIALGQGYVSDSRFRQNIGQGDDALVTYLADAMTSFANEMLREST
jgi:DNA-binding transcriptional MerR regulator